MLKAPVNPADMYFMKGIYGDKKKLPCIPGFEGVGEVIEGPEALLGKIAAATFFTVGGSYAQYSLAEKKDLIFFEKNTFEIEELVGCMINPLTCYGLLSKAEDSEAIV